MDIYGDTIASVIMSIVLDPSHSLPLHFSHSLNMPCHK